MNNELAIEILKQATLETTTGACEKCPRKDKSKTCIGCLDEAKEIVLNQLQQKENIINELEKWLDKKEKLTFNSWNKGIHEVQRKLQELKGVDKE